VNEQGPEDDRLIPATPKRVTGAYRPRRRTKTTKDADAQALEAKLLELAGTLEAVRRSEQDLADAFEHAAVGLQWVGPDGLILRVNQAQLDLLGLPRDAVVGHHFAEFHADRADADAMWELLGGGGTVKDREGRLRRGDGTFRHVLIDSSVRREDGRFVHSRCVIRDVEERRRTETALRASEQQLIEADRRKDEFLAMLAHELRNPLAPIANATEFFRSGALAPELQWCADVIDRQVTQLTRLIDDLVDVSRITRGRIELRRERIVLAPVIQAVLDASRPVMQKWGHELTVDVPAEGIEIDADPARLAQIVINLLHNAARYTPPGGRIGLGVARDADTLVIRVTDTGVGIPPDMLTRVFEMFTQLDRSIERTDAGLGIGLTLVQHLVELHGGTVTAYSAGPGTGSAFVVRLPIVATVIDVASSPSPSRAPSGRRILIVDDNQDAAETLAALLRTRGHLVRTAHDGLEGVAAAAAFLPAVVLLDLGMPTLNGYEVARRIRAMEGGAAMMLVALTGWGQEEARRRSREAGFDHHLTKPVEFPTLMSLLATDARTSGS